MKDRNDSRDVRPRIGSPLWVYLASVTAAGLAVLAPAVASVPAAGLVHLLAEPLFWAVAGLALLAEIRPIVAPGKSHPDYGTAALTFCFAAFLYWGFPGPRDLFDGPDTRLIVKSLVDLVRALGIRSVAEGVESPDAAGALAAIGCDAAQGRYYCGPLDPGAATTWLADHLRPTAARPRRGGAHPPRARKPGGRRRPAPVRRTAADG